jgi:8-oxo-dGTP diphosphatase
VLAPVALEVVVGLLVDPRGRVLLNQRRAGTAMAGSWEFPGGKREAQESAWDALCRELAEELGIVLETGERWLELWHDYADKRVHLDVWWISRYAGVPYAREQQCLRWTVVSEIAGLNLLAADWPIVDALVRRLSANSE